MVAQHAGILSCQRPFIALLRGRVECIHVEMEDHPKHCVTKQDAAPKVQRFACGICAQFLARARILPGYFFLRATVLNSSQNAERLRNTPLG